MRKRMKKRDCFISEKRRTELIPVVRLSGHRFEIGLFAAGVLFGTAGMKLLGSKDAKRAYAQTTAAALRAKDSVMTAVTAVREGADDVYAEAKAINAQRTEAETANVVEDTSAEEESQAE